MKICNTCDFSVPIEGEKEGLLECRRHAIAAVGLDENGDVVCSFPACEPHMWCGDWKHDTDVRFSFSLHEGTD